MSCSAPQYNPYPLFVSLAGRRAVVVGGGKVAERKVSTLLEHGADVTVVSPEVTETIARLADEGRVRVERRRYEHGDLAGAFVTFCATDDRAVNEAVFEEASSLNQLVNVVDVPDLCNVIVPSVVRRGPLQIAVSTGGASPTTAREVRRGLEEQFDGWWGAYVSLLGEVRGLIKARVTSGTQARTPLYEAVASDESIKARLAAGQAVDAEDVYAQVVAPLVSPSRSHELEEVCA